MHSWRRTCIRKWLCLGFHLALLFACSQTFCGTLYAQSTFGAVLGTAKDPSGSYVPNARVKLTNTGTNAVRQEVTDAEGRYQFNNVDVGSYQLTIESAGFQTTSFDPFNLAARDTKRIDVTLQVASEATTVQVEAVATIQTETSNVAETKGSVELTDLPVAIGTRASGSTSAFSTLTAQPGVQIDNSQQYLRCRRRTIAVVDECRWNQHDRTGHPWSSRRALSLV